MRGDGFFCFYGNLNKPSFEPFFKKSFHEVI
nr:MAG TPA: hypothetical protein [Caudoviricetes sp.]